MPNTVNLALDTPNTGDKSGSWGTTSVNANWQVVDGVTSANQTISLTGSSATTLSIATGVIGTGSLTPGAGPTQSANRVIAFSGTLSSNCVVTMPRPGSWIVKNGCTGAFALQLRATGTGNLIGLPPSEAVEVYCDGTNMDFVGLGRIGTYIRYAVATTPAWISACTVLPYLPCNSSTVTYLISTYPSLGASLGSTFGGNGITTFGIPDKSNRVGVPIGSLLTTGNCGFDGSVFGASGGAASLQAHSHTNTINENAHGHPARFDTQPNGNSDGSGGIMLNSDANSNQGAYTGTPATGLGQQIGGTTTGLTVSISTSGLGSSGNVQPSIIDGIEFIRAG